MEYMETELLRIPQELYNELLNIFMPSEDMRAHLSTMSLSDDQLRWMMLGSPVSLYLKRDWMSKLSEYEVDPKSDLRIELSGELWQHGSHYTEVVDEIDKAISNLENVKPGEVFALEDCWYDYDILEEKNCFEGVFIDVKEVKKHIREVVLEEKEDCGEYYSELPLWRRLTKWRINGNELLYTYYFLQDEVVWFIDEAHDGIARRNDDNAYNYKFSWNGLGCNPFFRSEFLTLPIPYMPGDIIEINTFPFGPRQNAIIYEICDHGRIVEIITKDYRGKWTAEGLYCARYGRFHEQEEYTSPLYKIRKAVVTDFEEQKVFQCVSEYINGDNDKGEQLFKAFYHEPDRKEGYSAEGLIDFIREL